VATDATEACPLGSGACAGSTLPLDRAASAGALGFAAPSRNALDAIGDRDVAIDLLHAIVRGLLAASRVAAECVIYCTPAFGYATPNDAAATGSSLMPQKRNPDPLELVRGVAAAETGTFAGALATIAGMPLSYHRDLQETKALVLRGTERGLTALAAFERAFTALEWHAPAMEAAASRGFTVATDVAEALVAAGVPARRAHELTGAAVAHAEREGRALDATDLNALAREANLPKLDAPLDAHTSVRAKRTTGSTHPAEVAAAIAELAAQLDALEALP
jgi:argininosuccinate lyase